MRTSWLFYSVYDGKATCTGTYPSWSDAIGAEDKGELLLLKLRQEKATESEALLSSSANCMNPPDKLIPLRLLPHAGFRCRGSGS